MKSLYFLFLLSLLLSGQSCADNTTDLLMLKQGAGRCYVRKQDGVPVDFAGRFWAVQLENGRRLTPDYFTKQGTVTYESPSDPSARFRFSDSLNRIELSLTLGNDGLDCSLAIRSLEADASDVAFPARLDIDTARLDYVIFPNELGVKLKNSFYRAQPAPKIWAGKAVGIEPLRQIAGFDCIADPAVNTTTKVQATPLAKEVLGAELLAQWRNRSCRVVRPATERPEYDLITSASGSFWGGHRVGQGVLFRLGGKVVLEERMAVLDLVTQTLTVFGKGRIGTYTPAGRSRIGLIDIPQCPKSTGWSELSVDEWNRFLEAHAPGCIRLRSAEELAAFIGDEESLAVINPYGEMLPTGNIPPEELHRAIKSYLSGGGLWVETGGYPFFNTLAPQTYNSLAATYPFGFSDFMAVNSGQKNLIVYGIQPQDGFVPMNFRTWADSTGAHLSRKWRLFVDREQGGETAVVRFVFDGDIREQIEKYADANGFRKPLSDKMPVQTLDTWRKAPLMKISGGTLRRQAEVAAALPRPSIIHVWDFLKGGFDKLYPEHLPPHPSKGTMDDFRALIDTVHASGNLFMPYTNNSWWCDAPAPEVLQKYGNEALFRDRNGNPVKEDYAGNYGWSISPYHPRVQEAAEKIAREFSELGCDILFEDQVGAREWIGFDFNPASPNPSAYYQGIIDLAGTASEYRPLATEQGYDRLINCQSEFCGLTWMLVPFKERPWWVSWWLRSYSDLFDEADYEAYPLAQYVARGNTFFTHHLGGPLVENSENLAWTLLLGYQMLIDVPAYREIPGERRAWIEMLSEIQRLFGPDYMGRPMRSFDYLAGSGNSGVIRSRSDGMTVVANLSDKPYEHRGRTIAPKGFAAENKNWLLGYLAEGDHATYILENKSSKEVKRYVCKH